MELVDKVFKVKTEEDKEVSLGELKAIVEKAILGHNKCFIHLLVLRELPQDTS